MFISKEKLKEILINHNLIQKKRSARRDLIFQIDQIPQGALPIYDKDIAIWRLRVYLICG